MKIRDLIESYQQDSLVSILYEFLSKTSKKSESASVFHLKGVVGSLDAVIVSAMILRSQQAKEQYQWVFVVNDRDEAGYFLNDIQSLLPETEVFLFPISYKRPYQYEEIENANVLQRAEVLNKINTKNASFMIVTYPEAMSEKVINRKTLIENTLVLRTGEKANPEELSEILMSYDFEKTDFVEEAGQFAIRGGIMDIYSYSNELPYRLELTSNQLESIRVFEPQSQLSVEKVSQIAIVPNVQTKLIHAMRESFLEFIPKSTILWFKDLTQTFAAIERSFERVIQSFEEILQHSGNVQIVNNPEVLFETEKGFKERLKLLSVIEYGNRFYFKTDQKIDYPSNPQPSFHKNFEMLTTNLRENQMLSYKNIISADSYKQIERLRTIFDELDAFVQIDHITCALREGFIDRNLKLVCYTDHQIFERFHRFKVKEKFSKSKAITLKELKALQLGDFVVHIDYGIGRFVGLEKVEISGKEQEVIRLVYKDNDLLFVNIHSLHKISKYSGKESAPPSISKLGSGEWEQKKRKIKRQVKDIAKDLISLYAKRRSAKGYAFQKDSYLQAELESSFLYDDTPDQAKATVDVKADMEAAHPMDRLVCGDVGFGKTEIAMRAAFKAVVDGKQVAVLVPTTILAMQHHKTFRERLAALGCKVDFINRFKSAAQIKETLKKVASQETDILIGTHRIVSKDVKFKDLGLLVIDEEQKFGVKTKEKLKEMRLNIDVLTLTATPIPRTLHFSLMGARDLSIIATPPPNRQPVTTEIHTFGEEVIRDAVSFEIQRGGQVFIVHNRVSDIESIANLVFKLVPDARIGIAHGQMDGPKLEKVMMKFVEGDYDVLVSTNIIESGLDIPNANTIIINSAHYFGLSDLHQMRGRVGRSNKKAFCYLLTPPTTLLSTDARKKLGALEEFSDLGDGFKVAMRDLDIRGAGNLLGAEQSGFISDLGYEMYHKILDEAIQELKEEEFKDLFQGGEGSFKPVINDCTIETDLQILIPDNYVKNISERLSLYSQLDGIKDEAALDAFRTNLTDRFGNPPFEVLELLETVKLRWIAEQIGFEKLTLKNETIKGYFVARDEYFKSGRFEKVLKFLQSNAQKVALKEYNKKPMMQIVKVKSIQEAIDILSQVLEKELIVS